MDLWILIGEGTIAVLALMAAYYFLVTYRVLSDSSLFGLPVGFLFIALSHGLSFVYQVMPETSGFALWLPPALQTYGFSFIAVSYVFQGGLKRGVGGSAPATLFSILSVGAGIVTLLLLVPQPLILPDVRFVEQSFRSMNLVFIAYIFIRIARMHFRRRDTGLLYVLSAFALLGLAEYSNLINLLDQSYSAFVFAYFLQIGGLWLISWKGLSVFFKSKGDRR